MNGTASARIKAARLLRGISQAELARRLVDAGLPFRLVGALEREELPLRSAHIHALSAALGFPQRWFTAEVDDLCPEELPPGGCRTLRRAGGADPPGIGAAVSDDAIRWLIALAMPLGGVFIFAGWVLAGSLLIAGGLLVAWLLNR
jgi:transcriptional regulator with XRE-family HTH domain